MSLLIATHLISIKRYVNLFVDEKVVFFHFARLFKFFVGEVAANNIFLRIK